VLEAVSFKKAAEGMGRGRVANARWERVHTVGAATLKPREANAVRTCVNVSKTVGDIVQSYH